MKRESGWYRVTHKDINTWHILFYNAYQEKWLYGMEFVEFEDLVVEEKVMDSNGTLCYSI